MEWLKFTESGAVNSVVFPVLTNNQNWKSNCLDEFCATHFVSIAVVCPIDVYFLNAVEPVHKGHLRNSGKRPWGGSRVYQDTFLFGVQHFWSKNAYFSIYKLQQNLDLTNLYNFFMTNNERYSLSQEYVVKYMETKPETSLRRTYFVNPLALINTAETN